MRLKKLIVHGFKSFADRTDFSFDSPITGIVGPNGCGKSNVVDGVKWVLGEQSAKSLRGEAMMDVIFNGSASRRPSGMAEVTLVFSNERSAGGNRPLNLDADEVAVGRRLFRDGTSEYQINNQPARLKDIKEMFWDTGIGVDAYSVIEQGRVAQLLESNPQERRLIFEEAAGISKFKAKKKEAQRKLERVEQNLLRVSDVVEEVDKRLRSVRIQAGRARTYQEHSRRLRELRLTYAMQEFYGLQCQREEHVSRQGQTRGELEQIETELSDKQLALHATRSQYEELSRKKQQCEYELVQAKAALQSAQQRQNYARQQLQQIADQLAQFEQDLQALTHKSEEVNSALAGEEQALVRLSEELTAHRTRIEQQQQAFHDTQLQLNQISREIEQHKGAILDLMRRSAAVSNRLGAIEIERRNIAAQQQRLGQRRQVVLGEIEVLEAGRRELDQALKTVTDQISAFQTQLKTSMEEEEVLGRRIAQVSEQLAAAREHRSGLLSRKALLEDLEARREGISEGVKSVLRQRDTKFPFIRGLVADVLRVDVEHAQVIEAALDGRDQMLVCDDSTAALAARDELDELEGRVNILCTDRMDSLQPRYAPAIWEFVAFPDRQFSTDDHACECTAMDWRSVELPDPRPQAADPRPCYDWNRHPQLIRLAIDLVRFEPEHAKIAQHLLGRTIVVDSLADAMELHASAPRDFRYVSHDGHVVEADGTLRAGPLTAAMGLISRRSELEALSTQIADVDRRIDELSRQLSTDSAQAKSLQEKHNALRNAIYTANTTRVQTTSRIAQNTDKQSAFRRELPVLERELQAFLDHFGRLRTEEAAFLEQRRHLESEQSAHQQQVEQLAAKLTSAGETLKQCGEALTSLRIQLGQVQEKQLASQQAVQRLKSTRSELEQQIQRITQTAEQVASRRSAVETDLRSAQDAEAQLAQKQEKLAHQIDALAAQVEQLGKSMTDLEAGVEAIGQKRSEVEQVLHQLEMKIGEVRVRLEALVQRTMDELQLDLPARWAELEQQGGYQPAEMNWDAVADEIRQLKDKLQRLGNVNLDSIGEQEELEKRQTFLHAQVDDLARSKQQLQELIETINTESADRFEKTFTAVREHFQGMFRKLFGGGKADIFLEIDVQPDPAPPAQPAPPEGAEGAPADPVEIAPQPPRKIDVLDAGIEIIAKPPGKQPCSIAQLSGGEKTMTCIALLMSIFKSKPSPFCLLDEVDAALDEANNQRFNLIVQEFLEQSQFIIITHSKRTMQIADVLYGVTMQEQGVSKRVSVKFDQVDAQGRINETAAA